MISSTTNSIVFLISLMNAFVFGYAALAGCPCQNGGAVGDYGALAPIPMTMQPPPSGYYFDQQGSHSSASFAQPGAAYNPAQYPQAQYPQAPAVSDPYPGGSIYQGVSPYSYQQPHAPVRMHKPTPPPGTIGQTFKLPSRPVPVEKHPRVGMIDVLVENANEVFVHDMNAMRTEDTIEGFRDAKDPNIWHFESKPLYPGLDHIYRIQANFIDEDGKTKKSERYVRLIMGRVVELTF